MNWRRGLVLAGIHGFIAIASFARDDAFVWDSIRSASSLRHATQVKRTAFQEEQTLGNSCDEGIWDRGPSTLANVAAAASLPVALATGWHSPCMPRSQRSWITNRMESSFGVNTRRAEIAADSSLSIAVFVLWILVGGYPLIHLRRSYLEPTVLITVCAILGAALAVIPHIYEFSRITMLIAAISWIWWTGLLFRKPVHWAWQSTLRGLRRLSN